MMSLFSLKLLNINSRLFDQSSREFELQENGSTIKPSNCIFGFESVDFVGNHVGGAAFRAMSEKVAQIQKAVRPQTKKPIRSFLGLSKYYRNFLPNIVAIAVPLTDATRKGVPNQAIWTDAMQNAFDTLKQRLCSTPILQFPGWNKPFVVRSDAFDIGVGAVCFSIK